MPHKTKDGWKFSDCGYYATKDEYTISECFVGDKPKYQIWKKNNSSAISSVFKSFKEAKESIKPKTNKDWEMLGRQLNVYPGVGEPWPKFKGRVREAMK